MSQYKVSYDKAKSRMLGYCARAERCIFEVRDKLYKLGLSNDEIENIVKYLIENNFINEQRYAEAFTNDKHNISGWGIVRIERELRNKNIPSKYISLAISELKKETEVRDKLFSILKSKKRTYPKSLDSRKVYERLLRFGMYRGYEYDMVKEMVSKIINFDECEDY